MATHLVLTYNHVKGYPRGVYQYRDEKVIVHSSDKRYHSRAPEKLSELMHSLYGEVDFEEIDKVIVYAGLNALDGALRAAQRFAHNRKDISLVACRCEDYRKGMFAYRRGVDMIMCECGGDITLGRMVREILEG